MTDQEKVIRSLEECAGDYCSECQYFGTDIYGDNCWDKLMKEAAELLKEQETEWEHLWDAPDGTFKGRCKKCGFVHFFIEGHDAQYKFCPGCGRRIEWQG